LSEVRAFENANTKYATQFDKGDLPMPPGRHVAVLTCMDARLDPAKFLGLSEGDAHVIRNAGGRADWSAIRSLAISQALLGTKEVVVIHHTECGMLTFSNADLRKTLREKYHSETSDRDFLPFTNLEQSVRDDVETIRESPLVSKDAPVHGFVYDVKTGRLEAVR
jgi:carbonic anhydrase